MENEQAANVETASLTFEEKVLQTIVGVALASIDGLISADGKFFKYDGRFGRPEQCDIGDRSGSWQRTSSN